ncbi:alpha-methylacyl-CoA racemase like protein [Danaus plexippus plexippus]|uniref:Alpha-methylacyl-CoA racemase like protein n=1 Tax=Danaus plexippus plexippus TaxID=278856 RepID=A0A212FA59_DANPL|nr:alpha-methylacyl-CoA racemase like protein [Danaus plexippus plexippus]
MALNGIKVVEMLGLAPGPFCGTVLADFGATVTVVQKIEVTTLDVLSNGKKAISLNLKCPRGKQVFKKLMESSDVLIDTYRPGVLEKLGLGPQDLMKKNPKLIYARLTGYGQTGFYKDKAGHDLNYVAMSGVLSMLGKDGQPPRAPINILADLAGGSLSCVLGIILALFERSNSGKGQIIDASMTEGAAYVANWIFKSKNLPIWMGEPGTSILDGGYPSYQTYKTKDNKFIAVAALEEKFHLMFLKGLNISEEDYAVWEKNECEKKFKEIFLTKTQQEWCNIFKELDACVTPVLDLENVKNHDLHLSRKSFYVDENNLVAPEPAPRLSRTPGSASGKLPSVKPGQHTIEILTSLGYKKSEIQELINNNSVYAYKKSNL